MTQIDEWTFQLARGIALAIVIGVSLLLEATRPHAPNGVRRGTNLGLWALNAAILGVICGGCVCAASRWAATEQIGLLNVTRMPIWVSAPATVFGLDALSYAWHRANHRLPLLWRFHRVHHLDGTPNFSTALRFHPGELLLSLPVRLAAVVGLGAPIEGVLVFEVLFSWANVLEHGNFDVSLRFEQRAARVFVTPALHRLHHSRRADELDTNFGTTFVFWDRLAGTYRRSSSARHFEAGIPGRTLTTPLTVLEALGEPLA
jgi:sterol desaturase/sphingolipid hydroxylase (fatty acid hydroxylase superfamily)